MYGHSIETPAWCLPFQQNCIVNKSETRSIDQLLWHTQRSTATILKQNASPLKSNTLRQYFTNPLRNVRPTLDVNSVCRAY